NGPVRLLINQTGQGRHWLGLRLMDRRLKRDLLGTRVGVFLPGDQALWRRVRTDGSYASANDPRLLFGLGDETRVLKVRAEWTDGKVEEWSALPVDQYTVLYRGSGRMVTDQ
ncbi:MAG: ASPIC/UnbV domain-containing protein, partial [Candidatus Aminicenantes bacterium]|nr:ASPIC/UnbV domain-containing protein [Candidatus Aminicenantes bacterium]